MTGKSMDINNIDIKKLNKIFEGIDFKEDKKVNNSIDLNLCQSCGSDEIVEDFSQGVLVCTYCGQVLESNIVDSNPEWKQFEDDGAGASSGGRCNKITNPLLPQSSLGTVITGYGKARLKTLHSWNAMPYRERTLNNEFKKIQDICAKGNIPKCVEDDVKILYKLANDCKHSEGINENKYIITRGINRVGISSGCMFLACLKNGLTRTSREIATLYGIKDQDMNKGFKTLLRLLKIKNVNLNIGTSKAEHFVKRYCEELKIKNIHIGEAIKIAQNIERLNIASDHTPYSVAAASILLMAENFELKSITKKKIAYEFGLSDVTIAKTYKEIEHCRHILSNNNAVNDIVKQINKEVIQEEIAPEVLERMKKFNMIESKQEPIMQKTIIQEPPIQKKYSKNTSRIEELKNNFDLQNAKQIVEHLKSSNKKIQELSNTVL
jgi:transcription initiation factor TFIIB